MHFERSMLRSLIMSGLVLCAMTYGMKREREGVSVGRAVRVRHSEEALLLQPASIQVPSTPVKTVLVARSVAISPQKAQVDARNTVRRIFEALNKGDEKLAVQTALQAFAEGRQKFPAYFSKIHWRTPLEGETEAQFKYKLNSALDSALLMCIANGGHSRQELIRPGFELTDKMNQSQVSFGGYRITLKNSLDGKFGYEMERTGDRETLSYDLNNSIKQTLTTWLFDKNDLSHVQEGLQAIFSCIPQELRINKEQFYHALIYGMISFLGSNFGQIEIYTGEGRADLIVQHDELGKCIIEFKLNQSAVEALRQITAQKYHRHFGSGRVLAVGINVQHDPLKVTCAKKMITITSPDVKGTVDAQGSFIASFSGRY